MGVVLLADGADTGLAGLAGVLEGLQKQEQEAHAGNAAAVRSSLD